MFLRLTRESSLLVNFYTTEIYKITNHDFQMSLANDFQ